jgi:ribonuclease BN (tRNA processing enzyme)
LDSAWANRRVGGIEALQLLNKIGQYESANYEGIHEVADSGGMLMKTIWKVISAMIVLAGPVTFAKLASAQTPALVKSGTRLITLGTRSGPIPTPGRYQSANLLVVNNSLYIIDTGPGVMRRLVDAKIAFRNIDNIFITHGHNDHTAGLGELLTVSYSYNRTKPVNIYGPPGTVGFVTAQLRALKFDSDIRISDGTRNVPISEIYLGHDVAPGVVFQDANVKVTAIENSHFNFPSGTPGFGNYKSYSYRFDTPDKSIVFTGDTGPSTAVSDLAKGADLLVSEVSSPEESKEVRIKDGQWATWSEKERSEFMRHMNDEHLTPAEVGKMAQSAGVKAVVLTHLPATPDPNDEYARFAEQVKTIFSGPVYVAKDLMEF